MSKRTKNQHFVPQFHLRHFANDQEQIWVLEKATGRFFETNIKNVACQRYYYDPAPDVRLEGPDQQVVDRFFTSIEDDVANCFRQVLKKALNSTRRKIRAGTRIISEGERALLAKWIVIQYYRTPEGRRQLLDMVENAGYMAMHAQDPSVTPRVRLSVREEDAAMLYANVALDQKFLHDTSAMVASHVWSVGVTVGSSTLVLSDQPVVMRNHLDQDEPEIAFAGLAAFGIEIALPLSPRVALILKDRRITSGPLTDGRLVRLVAKNATYYNSLQAGQSHSYVYGRRDVLDSINDFLDRNPHLRQPGGCFTDELYIGGSQFELPEDAMELRLEVDR